MLFSKCIFCSSKIWCSACSKQTKEETEQYCAGFVFDVENPPADLKTKEKLNHVIQDVLIAYCKDN